MKQSTKLKDYELLDMSNGEKLERFGKYILIRPDPQVIWNNKLKPELWKKAHARYIRSNKGGGHWERYKKVDDSWKINYDDIVFNLKPMGFKHTGIFPEQAVNWDYLIDKVQGKKNVKVLNLFAYTGGASLACLKAGANVVHVDSSSGITSWAKENVKSSGLSDRPIRFIVDDVVKFVKREIRRGNNYDLIVLDPPSYGRGKNGEVWNIEKDLYPLLKDLKLLLSNKPIAVVVNTYTGGFSGTVISNLLKVVFKDKGNIVTNEIGLKVKDYDMYLPCGVTTKWENIK